MTAGAQNPYTLTIDDVNFNTATGEITDYTDTIKKDIIIPDNFEGVAVTEIGDRAFEDDGITAVIIPNSVISIGEVAFGSHALTSLIIPNSVETIGSYAFASPPNLLTTVTIGTSVSRIEQGAFEYLAIKELNLPSSVTYIGSSAFSFGEGSIVLPKHYLGYSYSWSGGEEILKSGDTIASPSDSYAYILAAKMTAVNFAINYTDDDGTHNNMDTYTVEDNNIVLSPATKDGFAFEGWYKEATFLNKIEQIPTGSFGDLDLYARYTELYTLTIDDVEFSDGEITGYTNTIEKNIIIPDNFNDVAVSSIGEAAFYGNELTSVTIPTSVISIGEDAFEENSLTNVTIPDSVRYIGKTAFANNRNLSTVEMGQSVLYIGEQAFWSVKSGTPTYILPQAPAKIEGSWNDEDNSYDVARIYLADNYTVTVDDFLLNEEGAVNQYIGPGGVISIPTFVTKIGTDAFISRQLTSVTLPNTLTHIGYDAFADNQLTEVTIPNNVVVIGNGAFIDNQLTSVDIGSSVRLIDSRAFSGNQLNSVTLPDSLQKIGSSSFQKNLLENVKIFL